MELIIDGLLKKVENTGKGRARYHYPVVSIKKNGSNYMAYLNKAAAEYLDDIGKASWYMDENYVVLLPTKAVGGYNPIYIRGRLHGYSFPITLVRDKKVKEGHYKIYRYKSGFGFKRYERLEDKEE